MGAWEPLDGLGGRFWGMMQPVLDAHMDSPSIRLERYVESAISDKGYCECPAVLSEEGGEPWVGVG